MDSDTDLLVRWRGGDDQAGAALFERYYERVERFFLNKAGDADNEARDLVQDTFAHLVQNRDRIDDPDRFQSYLFSVAYNLFRSHLRDKYRQAARRDDRELGDDVSVYDVSPSPSAALWEKREQRLLLEGLRRIPFADQALLELYYWEDLTTWDIAEVLGIKRGTVQTRLRSARRRLEEAMTAIAESAEVLASTLSDLETWAAKCKQLRHAAP